MGFPACAHRGRPRRSEGLRWLAAEPFRVFFPLGAFWSLVGVALWPLFYQGGVEAHPLIRHGRLMIEGFGGAFVIGFLGTAGPRMASAPKWSPLEGIAFVGLHTAMALAHLGGWHRLGDFLFVLLMVGLLLSLGVRMGRARREARPPQLGLAAVGLLSGALGAGGLALAEFLPDLRLYRLASLLLHQGFLLFPILGVGSFLFPRILGGTFGASASALDHKRRTRRALLAMGLLSVSFVVEALGALRWGGGLRIGACLAYFWGEMAWRGQSGQGTMVTGLRASLLAGAAGIAWAAWVPVEQVAQRISVDHLLYLGGFGLLILVVSSRVLCGHSGQLDDFSRRSRMVRSLVGLALLALANRVSPALAPQVAVSHHQYAALSWVLAILLWFYWHRRRFRLREEED